MDSKRQDADRSVKCFWWDGYHHFSDYRFKETNCHTCGETGHMGKRNQRSQYMPTILVKEEKVTQKMMEVPQNILCLCLIVKAYLPIK